MDIHTGSQEQIHPVASQLQAFLLKQLLHQFLMKGTGEGGAVRQAKGMCAAVHTDTGRAIRTAARRDAEMLQTIRDAAECACRSGRHLRGTHPFSPNDTSQILIRQLGEKILHIGSSVIDISEKDAPVTGADR